MTVHHLAAGHDLTRQLTDIEYDTLAALKLVAPCYGCTRLLRDGQDIDEVVYHPVSHHPDIMRQVDVVLDPKKRN